MKTCTVADILSWNPCSGYTEESIKELFGRKEKATALDILNCKKVPAEDRIWAIRRNFWLSDRSLRLFAADCADHVLPIFEKKYLKDDRPRKAIEVARKYARGEIHLEEMRTAAAAANAAANAAAYADANAAAYDAAAYADAAASADAASAYADERNWQIERLKWYIEKESSDEGK